MLGYLLALCVTVADERDQAQISELARRAQAETGETVKITYDDQDYTGEDTADAAAGRGIKLEAVKLTTAKRGVVLYPHLVTRDRKVSFVEKQYQE